MPKLQLTNKIKSVNLNTTELGIGMYRVVDSADSNVVKNDEIVIVARKANYNENIITLMSKFVSYRTADISQHIKFAPLENNTQLTFNTNQ